MVNGKLMLAATTKVNVVLGLDPNALVDVDPASPYGMDARNATLQLPTQLSFHFTSGVGAIDAVLGTIECSLYGQAAKVTGIRMTSPCSNHY